jgi:hypothetical protein
VGLLVLSAGHDRLFAQQEYEYLSTGIGAESRHQKIPLDFTIKLVFATTKGELLANVEVNVYDSEGKKVFSAVSEGPWLFIDLPPGSYSIAASVRNCVIKKEKVNISAGFISEVVMRWNFKGKGSCR